MQKKSDRESRQVFLASSNTKLKDCSGVVFVAEAMVLVSLGSKRSCKICSKRSCPDAQRDLVQMLKVPIL